MIEWEPNSANNRHQLPDQHPIILAKISRNMACSAGNGAVENVEGHYVLEIMTLANDPPTPGRKTSPCNG